MCKLPRLRTISQAYAYIVEQDPDTAIAESLIRNLIEEGEIPYVKQGKKALVDIDILIDKIAEWVARQADQEPELTKNRRPAAGGPRSEKYGKVRAI